MLNSFFSLVVCFIQLSALATKKMHGRRCIEALPNTCMSMHHGHCVVTNENNLRIRRGRDTETSTDQAAGSIRLDLPGMPSSDATVHMSVLMRL